MPMPNDIGVIDLMLAVPGDDSSQFYEWIKPMLMDKESHEMFQMPAQYMFKDIPRTGKQDDYIPNLFPFKEQVINAIERRKQRDQEQQKAAFLRKKLNQGPIPEGDIQGFAR